MNNIPGFTAEASLYKMGNHYWLVKTWAGGYEELVFAQLPLPPRQPDGDGGPCRYRCGPCQPGGWQTCHSQNPDCDDFDRSCTCTPSCGPPQLNPSQDPCFWQRCKDELCYESWRPATGCTYCRKPGFQQCRDASGTCTTQPCNWCENVVCLYRGDCWRGGVYSKEEWPCYV